MNQGLKGYTKQLVHDIDNVGSLCMNMNKENANTHLVIPIVRTTGHSPIQLDLVYSYLERNEVSLFGKGFKLSSYKELTEISGGYRIYNGDGSYDDYLSSNGYFNKETLCTLESFVSEDEDDDTTYYRLKDMQGNNIEYAVFNNGYNYETNKVNGDFIVSIPQGSSGLKFYNRYSDAVYIDKVGDIVTIIYKYGSKVMSTVKLTLSSFKLSKIQYYEGESTLYKEVLLAYSDTELLVKDNTHKNICKIEFLNSLPHKVFNGFETIPEDETEEAEDEYESTPTYSITYENYKTIVVNKQSKQFTYYFNNQNLPIFEKDNTGKIRKYMYDVESKRLVFEEPFATDSTNNLMHGVKFTDFYGISHLTVADKDSSLIDEAVSELFGNESKLVSGSGSTSYTIDKTGQAGEVYSLSFFAEGNSTEDDIKYLRLSIIYDLNGTEKIFALPVGKMQAFTIYEKAPTNFEEIKILISLENTQTVSIGGFTLLKNAGPTECVYTNNNLTKIQSISSVEASYTTDNFPEEITSSEGGQTNITYTANKRIASQENEVGTKTTKMFHSTYKNKEIASSLVSSDGTMSIHEEKDYSTDGRLVTKETNTLGRSTSYEYDSLERLAKVTDALNKATTMSYYKGNLSSITLNGEDVVSQSLSYDDRDRLSQIITDGGSIYKFEYNYKNRLIKVKVDNQVITEYDYDDYGNVKWLKHASGDYFNFSYDENNNLQFVSCNAENLFEIECDVNGNVLSVLDIKKEEQITYEYDKYDKIKRILGIVEGKTFEIQVKRNNKEKEVFVIREVDGNKVTHSINDFLPKKEVLGTGDDVKTVNFTQGNIDTYGSTTQNMFEIIPLHTTFDSVNGAKPSATEFMGEENESIFTYNSVNKRYCFDGTKGLLEYATNFTDTGVILARVFIPSFTTTQNIFTLSNGIKLNVNTSGKLVLNIDESNYTTNLTMTSQIWHTVALSIGEFGNGSNSISSIDRDYRVYLDGSTYSFTDSVSTQFTSMHIKVGTSLLDSDIKFDGQMEMLCFRNAYSELSTLNSLKEELDSISFKLTIDEFDRLSSKEIYNGSKSFVKNSYLFKSKEGNAYQTSSLVSNEWIYLNGVANTVRYYNYDGLNRVISIQDAEFGNKTYAYNERGFLENDNGKVITYDNNGNIDSITEGGLTRQFTYHSTIKDKLLSAGDVTLTYSSTNPLYPSKIGNKDLTWVGKRLVSISLDGVTYSYTYNEKGQRVKKSSPSEDKVFFYEGDRLVTEIGTNNRLDFLYDSQGLLFGFILNNTSKYFYVRDILQNILGIVDENGILVVKYEYEAFGKILSIEDFSSNSIGNLNPFRYKGYYYDSETQLYWVSSRYYSPELCRWISPDSIEYLDPESINGLNLYAYCSNDSVNKYDPTGHFALTTFGIWAIVGIVSAAVAAGGGAQLVSNAIAGETGSDLWRGVAGAALGSGVNALALCLSPFTGGTSLAFAAGLGAAAQTGVDTLETVIRGETVNGWQTVADLGINFITTFAGNWLGAKLIPTNGGWFKPQEFLSVFMKPFGQKILLQTAIGAGLSAGVNFVKKFDWSSVDWEKFVPLIPVPMIPMYPYF